MRKVLVLTFAIMIAATSVSGSLQLVAQDDDLSRAIAMVKQVDKDGVGHDEAVKAMKVLNSADVNQVPQILAGMDGANKLAVNWLRSAVLSIVSKSDSVPTEPIKAYFENREGSHLGRLMAFDLLSESNEGWADSVVPGLIDDPSLPLRRKAVKAWVAKAEKEDKTTSLGILATALDKARDVDQVIQIAKLLDESGVAVDLQKQLGFVNQWSLVGCFDNKDEAGFEVPYGPEKSVDSIDLAATYTDLNSEEAEWTSYATVEPTGIVDLNEAIGNIKGATVYAVANFRAEEDRSCEIRVGCINAHKVWVNGELVMSNEVYHNGISPDKFSAPAELKKGDNQILIKVCQNEMTQPWAQRWQFQLRVCDETGKAIQPAAPPTPQQ